MPLKLATVVIAISLGICQQAKAQRVISKREMQQEQDRIRAIVETIVGPTAVPGLPRHYVFDRTLQIERPAPELGRPELDADDDDEVVDAPPVRVVRRIVLSSETFDAWMYGNMSGKVFPKAWLNSILKEELLVSGFVDELTAEELTKLHIAGTGDIKRLLSEIELSRQEYEAIRHDLKKAQIFLLGQDQLSATFERGPFGRGSLFNKTLTKIRDDRRAIAEAKRKGLSP